MSITLDMYDVGKLPVLVYTALTIVFTFPLVLHLSTRLPFDLGDPLLTAAVLWWNAHVTPFTEDWWNGFGFFPATGSTAFSADQLGASLIATPLQWLGASPIAAYNVLFLLSWPLSALAAHYCARTITGREDAAYVAGLAYGFNPARVAHLEHLELLMAFGMPAALAALHRYLLTGRPGWAVAFSAFLVVQALASSYYALFFTVLFGLWCVWFLRPADWRKALTLAAAGAAAVLIVSPVFLGYSRIHDLYGMQRKFEEVLTYSADVSSFVTASSLSALWHWTSSLNGGERQLFPGLTITLLATAGLRYLHRRRQEATSPASPALPAWPAARVCALLGIVFAAIGLVVAIGGPFRIDAGWLRVSASDFFKPFSVALAFATLALAFSRSGRTAFRERSTLAFYLAATAILLLCSLGPEPTLLGRRILYEPPYAWLMRLPFFDETVRVPARFGMLAVLTLSMAAALAYARLTRERRRAGWLFAAVVAGILADGWMRTTPLVAPPAAYAVPRTAAGAVLELPLGDVIADTAAMFRVTAHGRRTVNGYNGYEPLYYHVLRLALADRDSSVLDALASFGPLLIAVNANAPDAHEWRAFAAGHTRSARVGNDAGWEIFQIPEAAASQESACRGEPLAIAQADANGTPVDLPALTDGNPATRWITPEPQQVGDTLVLQLAAVGRPCRLVISRGAEGELYARRLEVAVSLDGMSWTTVADSRMGGAAFLAALEDPRDTRVTVTLPGEPARFVRLRLGEDDARYQWAVAGLSLYGS